VRWADLCVWYYERWKAMAYLDLEEESRIGHETLRKVVDEEKVILGEWEPGKELPKPFNPVHNTVLDLEGYYWHVMDLKAAGMVRESPDAPLPPDPAAAVVSMLSADEEEARQQIAGLEEALRAWKGTKPPPHRVAELFRRLYDQGLSAMPTYRRQRKPRKPRTPKDEATPPPESPPVPDGPDQPPPTEGPGRRDEPEEPPDPPRPPEEG
jgi:hypothetical protein